jgi:hypothetical protein
MRGFHVVCIVSWPVLNAGCGIAWSYIWQEMVDEVNRRLPPDERFFPAFWHMGKTGRLLSEYARLYPNGKLKRRCYTVASVSAVSMVMAGFAIFLR